MRCKKDSTHPISGFENGAGEGNLSHQGNYKHQPLKTPKRHVSDGHYASFFFKTLKVHKCSFLQISVILLVFCFNWCWDDKYSGPSLFKDSVFVSSSRAKIYDTQISTHCAFMHVCGHMQSDIWVPRDSCYQLTLHQLMPAFCSWAVSKCPFHGLLVSQFSCLCLEILTFKMVPKQVVLKCYLVFPSARKLQWCVSWRKPKWLTSFLWTWVIVLLAVSLLLNHHLH